MIKSNRIETALNPASCSNLILIVSALLAACEPAVEPSAQPKGQEKSVKTQVLEGGAALLQTNSPLESMNIYLDGFHASKEDPSHQMEAHHFCHQVNEDFAQCALFDGNTRQANLVGIEYIISESLFESLPEQEKTYWHPHNFEILSGQLIAHGIPEAAENELMKGKMNSYGKTWHVWNSSPFGKTGDKMPLGEPSLEWSFNRNGEVLPGLVEQRNQRLNVTTDQLRSRRTDLIPFAKPQRGVDALKGKFSRPVTAIPGVADKNTENLK
ncbi:MAG: OBAP family protein [Methylococcales bacterium]|nr:OBAP family protein [Methylococcales bacterium]